MLAHNVYLQLWAELGLLAPVAWLLLWFVVLRPRAGETVTEPQATQDVPAVGSSQPTNEQVRTKALGYLLLAGGVLGALFMITCFGRMHGHDLYKFLTEVEGRDQTRVGALAALVTPACFVGAFFLLCRPRRAAIQVPSDCLWMGVRAGVGAILVHQLVDFDMTAQAIMAWLFLLGGFLLAQGRADERPGLLARASCRVMPVLSAVLVPLISGQERDNALEDEKDLRTTQARLQNVKLNETERKDLQETLQAVYEQMTRSRERAAQWAPYDGSAALDLSLAYLQLMRSGTKEWQPIGRRELLPLTQLVTEQMERTKELRPRWHGARLVAGHVYMEWALDARGKGLEKVATGYLEKAETEYREAIRRYPLLPSSYLVLGDALLLQGKVKEAAASYLEAWAVDRRVLDANVRFASIFHDPLPGCLIKHGRDLQIQERLGMELARPSSALDRTVRKGLMVRQVLVAAWRLLGSPRKGTISPIEQFTSRIELIHACEGLAAIAPEDGHAALFHALALRRFHQPEVGARQQAVRAKWEWAPWSVVAPAEQAWAAAAAFALERERRRAEAPGRRAAELQAASVGRGSPDTLPQVYEELRLRFGLPAPAAGGD
jgi:tetratricopeptide (TPR) repeat protein